MTFYVFLVLNVSVFLSILKYLLDINKFHSFCYEFLQNFEVLQAVDVCSKLQWDENFWEYV